MSPREKTSKVYMILYVLSDVQDCHLMKGCNKQENFIIRDAKTEA